MKKQTDPLEYFPTPDEVTRAILPHLHLSARDTVLDPCSGEGHLLMSIQKWFQDREDQTPELTALEIHPTRHRITSENGFRMVLPHGNSLRRADWGRPSAIVMNPPFGYAMEFWKDALAKVREGGQVAMLVKTSFLQTKERAEVLRSNMPDAGLLTWRPSFYGNGNDWYDYVWLHHHPGRESRMFHLWREPQP